MDSISRIFVLISLLLCDIMNMVVTSDQLKENQNYITNTKVQDLVVFSKNSKCIFLRWKSSAPVDEHYYIKYRDNNSSDQSKKNYKVPKCKQWLNMTNYLCGSVCNLKRKTLYFLKVRATSGNYSHIVNSTTTPERPSPPRNLNYSLDDRSDLLLSWEHPLLPNGIIKGFYVTVNNFSTNMTITAKEVSATYNYTLNIVEHNFSNRSLNVGITAYNLGGNSTPIEYLAIFWKTESQDQTDTNRDIFLILVPLGLLLSVIVMACYGLRRKRKDKTSDTLSTSGFSYLSKGALQDISLLEEYKKRISIPVEEL